MSRARAYPVVAGIGRVCRSLMEIRLDTDVHLPSRMFHPFARSLYLLLHFLCIHLYVVRCPLSYSPSLPLFLSFLCSLLSHIILVILEHAPESMFISSARQSRDLSQRAC